MKSCPSCGLRYSDESAFCFVDAEALAPPPGPDGGTCVGGRFRLESLASESRWAQLFRGRERLLVRPVWVKLYRLETGAVRDAFVQSLAVARRLSHDNIAPILGGGLILGEGSEASRGFVARPCTEAQSLAELLAHARLDASQCAGLVLQVLAALERAHAFGAVHGDLRPPNLLYHASGHLDVVDVGLGRTLSRDPWEDAPEALAAQHYLAPELGVEARATSSADLYAAGVVAFEMLLGRRLYDVPDAATLRAAAATGVRVREVAMASSVPASFAAWLARMLAPNPAERPASAFEARTSLQKACSEGGILPMLDAGRAAPQAYELDGSFAQWSRHLPLLETLAERGFVGAIPAQAQSALNGLRVRGPRFLELSRTVRENYAALDAISGRARESRDRLAGQIATVHEEAQAAVDLESTRRAAAAVESGNTQRFAVVALAMRRELARLEARSALVTPDLELAAIHRRLAEHLEAWEVARQASYAAERDLKEAQAGVGSHLKKLEAFGPSLRVREANIAEEFAAAESDVVQLGEDTERLEMEMGELAARLAAPLRAKPELGPIFRDMRGC